ncbi:MAG: OsmC family protein [Chloroflexota bacterium]
MGNDAIKLALAGAVEYLAAHPAEARYRDAAATATLRGGLVVDVAGVGGERATTDMVASVGGSGTAPSPGWLFRAAVASCVATLIAMRAATEDVALEALEVRVDSESDDRGILGIEPSIPAGPLSVRVTVSVKAPGHDAGRLRGIVEWGVAHCPVTDAVERAVPLEVDITV